MNYPLIIGIAGGSASGKTTVTRKILERLDTAKVVVLRHDFYYRDLTTFGGVPPEHINFDHPDSLETSLLINHLVSLKRGQLIRQPLYDFTTYRRLPETKAVEP